jgi:Zn-dependent protease with chaperone function
VDFFERQDKARRSTKLLVFYFALAVLSLIVAVDVAVALTFSVGSAHGSSGETAPNPLRLDLMAAATLGTLAIVSIGSISKTLQLARGGSAVAELLDGRLIHSGTRDANERKLLNIVEEMSIASGVPVPQVYVMDNEDGINAFAAGHSASDAAISVTRGALRLLTRDELQGVIAHEFSHILNGDMRLNIRLMGLIFGILCLTIIGRVLIRTRGRKNPLPLLGLALIIIGFVGVFFGRLIQAAVSRQREGLADASSAQFTRNPAGLAGALKKIGGLEQGSKLKSPRAGEASHLLFANGMGESFFELLETHPLLIERIRALDPSFDGKFPTQVLPVISEPSRPPPPPTPPATGFAPIGVASQAIMANVGEPTTEHLHYATDFRRTISPAIAIAARDPIGASALVYALLLANESETRQKQLDDLARVESGTTRDETQQIWPEIQDLPAHVRIPLVDLALPALRQFSLPQFERFRTAVETLSTRGDDLFAYMLQKIVTRHLETHFFPDRRAIVQFYNLHPLASDCGLLLSATAYAGQDNATDAYKAFTRGAQSLGRAARAEIPWLPPEQCTLAQLDPVLERLSQAVPQIKKNVLNACAETVAADNNIQEREAELLRAIADALDCPIPPFASIQSEVTAAAGSAVLVYSAPREKCMRVVDRGGSLHRVLESSAIVIAIVVFGVGLILSMCQSR